MAYITTTDMKPGVKIEIDNQPYAIIHNDIVRPGKGQAFNRIRVKNLLNNKTIEVTMKSGDRADLADVIEDSMRMLYRDANGVVFMNDTTFDQVTIQDEHIGDAASWLLEDQIYSITFYKGTAISITPPTFMELLITDTLPGVRGNTASGRVLKPATLETGATIQIPIFVDQGEKIKVDTRTGEYVSRVSD